MLDIYRAVGEPRIFAIGLADPAPDCLVEQAVNESMSEALGAAEAMLIERLGQVTLAQIAKGFEARYASCVTAAER
jgi:DNA-binding IscR family transcriptional regulator